MVIRASQAIVFGTAVIAMAPTPSFPTSAKNTIYLGHAGSDYTAVSSAETFGLGSVDGTQRCVDIDILEDDLEEGNERFRVVLYSADSAAILRRILTVVTIIDNDGT